MKENILETILIFDDESEVLYISRRYSLKTIYFKKLKASSVYVFLSVSILCFLST